MIIKKKKTKKKAPRHQGRGDTRRQKMERSGGGDQGEKDDKKRLLLVDGKKKRKLQESKMNDPSDYGVVLTPEVPKPAPRITAGTMGGVRKKKRKGNSCLLWMEKR